MISFTLDFETWRRYRNNGDRVSFYIENKKDFLLFMPIEGFLLKTSMPKSRLEELNITRETFVSHHIPRSIRAESVEEMDFKVKENLEKSIWDKLDKETTFEKYVGVDFNASRRWLLAFIESYEFPLITDITDKQRKSIKNLFIRSLERGFTIGQLEMGLLEILGEDNEYKVEMIIRTETSTIANESSLNRYEKAGIKKVKWIAVMDNRTSDICRKNNGKEFTIENARGRIPAHINCRSSWMPIVG